MKKLFLCCFAALSVLITSCSKSTENDSGENDSEAVRINMTFSNGDDPFENYMVRFDGTNARYILNISRAETEDTIKVEVENDLYRRTVFFVEAPDGYTPYFPETKVNSSYAANVIKNDLNNETLPDLLQFSFVRKGDDDTMPYFISSFYTVDDDARLHRIDITDLTRTDDYGRPVTMTYLDRTQFNHTEPDTFIYEISVDDNMYDENGEFIPIENRVRIKVMTFDKNTQTMSISKKHIAEYDPLYFGYAYWAAANTAAQYFTLYTLPDVDYSVYEEAQNSDADYYLVDSDRFGSVKDLKNYLGTIFSDDIAAELFSNAPQDYRDINGRLYTRDTDDHYDISLGTLTFTDYYVTDTRMMFYSRQVKYDSDGNFETYTDGGNFEISCEDSDHWKIVRYRYPYS